MYLRIDVSTLDMTISLQTALNYHIADLHNNTHRIAKNISRHPINQFDPINHLDNIMLHPMELCLICNSKEPQRADLLSWCLFDSLIHCTQYLFNLNSPHWTLYLTTINAITPFICNIYQLFHMLLPDFFSIIHANFDHPTLIS